MLFKRQKVDWLLVPILALGLFTYASYQPRFRLRPDMPAEFLDATAAGSPQTSAAEEMIARGYWKSLVHDIEPKYGYGYALPSDPPADFTLASSGAHGPEDASTRIRYWRRAQHVWYLPNAWQKSYKWDFHWTSDLTQNFTDWVHRQIQHAGGD
jgi:hypothetical protein